MTHKEKNQEIQLSFNNGLAAIYESLSPEDKEKFDAVNKAKQILQDAQVPYWLFAEGKDIYGIEQYISYNWVPEIYEADGSMSKAGQDFLKDHYQKLFYAVDYLLGFVTNTSFGLEATSENRIKTFASYCFWEHQSRMKLYPDEPKITQ